MKNIIILFIAISMPVLFSSCQEEFEPGDAGAKMISGDWIVGHYSFNEDKSKLEKDGGYYTIRIYNTSMQPDSLWLEGSSKKGSKLKMKKTSENSFEVFNGGDITGTVTENIFISEAQVIGRDSVIYRVVLKDSFGNTVDDFYEAGHRYTGWPDDEH